MKNLRLADRVILAFYLLPKDLQDKFIDEILKEYYKNEKH